jgi:hypothetical protein
MRALAPEVRLESFNPQSKTKANSPINGGTMSKKKVSELITGQEIAFVHLLLSGIMTDHQAAEAAGLNPDTAAYIKAKPCVQAYMLEHCTAVQQLLVQQETEELRRFNLSRDRVLARLWQIADLAPEMTRNSISAQVKALSMIVAIEGLIPDRRTSSPQNKPAPLPVDPPFYVSEWMRNQQTAQAQEEAAPEPSSAPGAVDDRSHPTPEPAPAELSSRPERSAVEGPAVPASSLPRVPMADYVAPDTRRPFSIDKNRFGRRR